MGDTTAQPTQWQTVDLVSLNRAGRNQVPCELLEQLKQKALPLFTSRNLQFHSSCVPHQATVGQIQFTVDVLHLAPAAPAAAPSPAT